jgi:hypothetical protein
MQLSEEQIRIVCKSIVEGVERDMGPNAIFELLSAIDRHHQWHTEIVCSRPEAEKVLLEEHGAFDSEIWAKVKSTGAWETWRQRNAKMRLLYLHMAVNEVVQSDLQKP